MRSGFIAFSFAESGPPAKCRLAVRLDVASAMGSRGGASVALLLAVAGSVQGFRGASPVVGRLALRAPGAGTCAGRPSARPAFAALRMQTQDTETETQAAPPAPAPPAAPAGDDRGTFMGTKNFVSAPLRVATRNERGRARLFSRVAAVFRVAPAAAPLHTTCARRRVHPGCPADGVQEGPQVIECRWSHVLGSKRCRATACMRCACGAGRGDGRARDDKRCAVARGARHAAGPRRR